MVREHPLYQLAADLPAAATYTGLPVPCRGAMTVAFHISATNANVAQSYVIEVRKAALGGVAASPWQAASAASGGVTALTASAAALNAGGQVQTLAGLSSAAAVPNVIHGWDEARLKIVGHLTLTITGLAVRAQVNFPEQPYGTDTDLTLTSPTIP